MKFNRSSSWSFAQAIVILSYVCSATTTFAGQASNWKADWDATVRAAERRESELKTVGDAPRRSGKRIR